MPAWIFRLLWSFVASVHADLVPRVSFPYGDSRRSLNSFHQSGVSNCDTFFLSRDQEVLYVGARDTLFSLSTGDRGGARLQMLSQLPWKSTVEQIQNCISKAKSKETECFNFIRVLVPINQTHLYACGSNAFSPICAYIDLENFTLALQSNGVPLTVDGKGQSPFDPHHKHTAILVEGELYTGTMNNFQGNEPIIYRNLGTRTFLKTDSSLGWLHADASFVASFSPPGDKVYFLFEETAKEFDFFEKLTVSRVARVCKNDVGGEKVLQKKWTTFLKAQLLCSLPGHFPFNVVHHAAELPDAEGGAVFFGVFTSQWQVGGTGSSAVCAFALKDIERVFDGNYKEVNKESLKWTTYTGPVSNPRPGSCSTGTSSDRDLSFMKEHYLMDQKVKPSSERPLLIKQNTRYTRIAIHQTPSVSGKLYNVMFLGTDKGYLHKAVILNGNRDSHIIEEIQLFREPEAIQNLELADKKGVIYVGFSQGILQLPLANCSVYSSCFDCILSRDPYCAWDRKRQMCREIHPADESTNTWLQDIETGNPSTVCLNGKTAQPRTPQRPEDKPVPADNLTVPLNSMLKLRCPHLSALANYSWKHSQKRAPEEQVVVFSETLVFVVKPDTLGLYECWASENGFHYQVAQYRVTASNGKMSVTLGHGRENEGYSEKAPVSNVQSYWTQFVTVTVLLTLTVVGILALVLFSYHDKVKAKSKVQGCSTPEAAKLARGEQPPEKAQPHGGQTTEGPEFQNGGYQTNANSQQSCCVEVGGTYEEMDLDNNRLSLVAADKELAKDPEAD
ncbi:semaphorin-4A [Rhinatrema bivittatum]|uniref:semaphorin-4A n=1 Tax=Rhinatrema bivittatum TaxID=194408 RepID=UPI00112A9D80|nr:semaphorin-4A [Rhinatrema bivittatum]XP_029436257.1 semaphorin-4A [Rhinatrema bivittatum]XP_029436258.1 semaphorin-4A [Rhinatrema bivittatum]